MDNDPRYEFVEYRDPPPVLTRQESTLIQVLLGATLQLLEEHSDTPEAKRLQAFTPLMKALLTKLGGAQ